MCHCHCDRPHAWNLASGGWSGLTSSIVEASSEVENVLTSSNNNQEWTIFKLLLAMLQYYNHR